MMTIIICQSHIKNWAQLMIKKLELLRIFAIFEKITLNFDGLIGVWLQLY